MIPSVVFDSSALIAFVKREPGADVVLKHLGHGAISAVNLQELAKVLLLSGLSRSAVRSILSELRLDVRAHDHADAIAAAELAHDTRRLGSGLGERSCMALAIRLGVPALTTDRAWAELKIAGLQVLLAR